MSRWFDISQSGCGPRLSRTLITMAYRGRKPALQGRHAHANQGGKNQTAKSRGREEKARCAQDTLKRLDPSHPSISASVTYLPVLPQRRSAHGHTVAAEVPSGPSVQKIKSLKDLDILVESLAQARVESSHNARGTTLQACEHMTSLGRSPCALNFASAKNPGGGFLGGASAQEESLCRCSGLYLCIKDSVMHKLAHKDNRGGLYHDTAVYSPGVPVIKNDAMELLARPYSASFISCPAVNAGVARKRLSQEEVNEAMKSRIELVLKVAVAHGEKDLVLGAFGCGVFQNDVASVASVFASFLQHPAGAFSHAFDRVTFAIPPSETASIFKSVLGADITHM